MGQLFNRFGERHYLEVFACVVCILSRMIRKCVLNQRLALRWSAVELLIVGQDNITIIMARKLLAIDLIYSNLNATII